VSALGHYLEEEGIATAAISLIRPQTEKTRPPRALWVPFELGRPFGPPSDPAFQRRVISAALRLLERRDGPVLIEDFPDDDPRAQSDPTWQAPPLPQRMGPPAEALAAELPLLRGAHDAWVAQYRRTTVGLAGLPIDDCVGYVADWLRGKAPASPREGYSAPLLLRFAVDDVKAFWLEAAAAGGAHPSSRQLGDWFWNDSAAGAALYALQAVLQRSDDDRLRLIVANFIVPAARARNTG
jgi:hypothetical protein